MPRNPIAPYSITTRAPSWHTIETMRRAMPAQNPLSDPPFGLLETDYEPDHPLASSTPMGDGCYRYLPARAAE